MIKLCLEQWDKNKDILREYISSHPGEMRSCDYKDLVKLVVTHILNRHEEDHVGYEHEWSTNGITEIDDGNYQGTLVYMIPLATYQPSSYEYLATFIEYGSCSYCDTLQGIQCCHDVDEISDRNVNDYMTLCKDIVSNIVKPFNNGWRNDPMFDEVVMDKEG